MNRIKGLELLFNLEKKNLKSKEDCVVAVFHSLLINENFNCVGVGDEWPETISTATELLPCDWNNNQDVYSLRYISRDLKSRILLKLTRMEHILQVDVVKNEDSVASMSVPVENFIANLDEYATAYKDLDSLCESFRKDIMQKLQPEEKKKVPSASSGLPKRENIPEGSVPPAPLRNPGDLRQEYPYNDGFPRFPNVGGRDLDPLGRGGGMLMDPSRFGIPARPSLQDFGIGIPGGLPRSAVPPGARFDPITPPFLSGRYEPNPTHFRPPDFDDFM